MGHTRGRRVGAEITSESEWWKICVWTKGIPCGNDTTTLEPRFLPWSSSSKRIQWGSCENPTHFRSDWLIFESDSLTCGVLLCSYSANFFLTSTTTISFHSFPSSFFLFFVKRGVGGHKLNAKSYWDILVKRYC